MYHRLLVPILPDHDKAGAALKIAEAIAEPDAKITLLHVTEAIPAYVSAEIPQDVLESGMDSLRSELAEIARAGKPGTDYVILKGAASRSILDYAKDHDIDCIVIYSHKPGLEQFFLGSTASNIVGHAHCSVHVIR